MLSESDLLALALASKQLLLFPLQLFQKSVVMCSWGLSALCKVSLGMQLQLPWKQITHKHLEQGI